MIVQLGQQYAENIDLASVYDPLFTCPAGQAHIYLFSKYNFEFNIHFKL